MKNNTTHPISSSSQPNRTYLKLTWKVIYHLKRQPYFFLANLYLKQVLARRMSWLTSFAWRYSTCGMCEPRITKWKIFLSTVEFEPRSFCLRSEGAKRWAIRADKNLSLKFEPLSLVKVHACNKRSYSDPKQATIRPHNRPARKVFTAHANKALWPLKYKIRKTMQIHRLVLEKLKLFNSLKLLFSHFPPRNGLLKYSVDWNVPYKQFKAILRLFIYKTLYD